MTQNFFVAIDFDGTITNKDITDAVIQKFAKPGWEEAEELWVQGVIGSKKCLELQMGLIETPLSQLVDFVDGFTIDRAFLNFAGFLREYRIPHGIISDGFHVFAKRILQNYGLEDIPIYANGLKEENGILKTLFPYSKTDCPSGVCKCMVANNISKGNPVILIGDGRSDFCIAEKAVFVFSKNKLTNYCKTNGVFHAPFKDFNDVESYLRVLVSHMAADPKGLLSNIELPLRGLKYEDSRT